MRRANRQQGSPGATGRLRYVAWTSVLVCAVIAAAAVVAWLRYAPHAVMSVNGEPLGRLPAGVRVGDLNLLLITLDTTRADRIHAYGFNEVETPNLDRVAREGVLFEQAIAHAPLTLPAH